MTPAVAQLVTGRDGLEIGGPSPVFGSTWRVYPLVGALDGVNFSADTIWHGHGEFPYRRQYIAEATDLSEIGTASYDFLLASHCLEHVANPLKALVEWRRVLKPGGALLLVLPNRRHTFDHARPVTTFEHLLDDFRNDVGEDDLTHLDEILALHDLAMDPPAGSLDQFRERSLKNLQNRALHHHVFDAALIEETLQRTGFAAADVTTDGDFYAVATKAPEQGTVVPGLLNAYRDLPDRPPSRTLVLFAHYDPHGVVDRHVAHYLGTLRELDATIVFISACPSLTEASVSSIGELCAGVYSRENTGWDFGSWHFGWQLVHAHGWSMTDFDRLVLVNDSVYAPLFPLEEMWSTFEGADMYGAIESEEAVDKTILHLQSFFLAWDLNRKTRAFLRRWWDNYEPSDDYDTVIERHEIGLSVQARKAGLAVKPFVSPADARRAYRLVPDHWSSSRFSRPMNNTILFWDGLIEHLRFPFLKVRVARDRRIGSADRLRETITRHTDYPHDLIQANEERLGFRPPHPMLTGWRARWLGENNPLLGRYTS